MDELGMTLVDFWKLDYRDKPFIMAQQAYQVFYVKDLTSEHWFVTVQGKKQIDVNEENLSNLNIGGTHTTKNNGITHEILPTNYFVGKSSGIFPAQICIVDGLFCLSVHTKLKIRR